MPFIEKKYRVKPGRAGRAIGGISMGGFGALRMAFAYPQLFSSVSAQSPALILDSPQNINAAARSGSPVVRALTGVFGNPIDVAHWQANNPFVLAKKNRGLLRGLAIYFNCGQNDDYGFEKGAAALDKQLTEEHIPHEYHSYSGDHSLTYFLSHLGETMEFHSRAFTGKNSLLLMDEKRFTPGHRTIGAAGTETGGSPDELWQQTSPHNYARP